MIGIVRVSGCSRVQLLRRHVQRSTAQIMAITSFKEADHSFPEVNRGARLIGQPDSAGLNQAPVLP